MLKTTAQSQQESQKTRARPVLFWKLFYKKKNVRAFNVARPRQRNIYQITSPTTCNLYAYRQASELRLNNFFISTTLFSFEQLLYLAASWFVAWWFLGGELVGGEMVSRRRVGWWRNSLVARWSDTVTRDRDNKAHTHTIHINLPFTRKSKYVEIKRCENCSSWSLTYKFCAGTH